MTQVCVCDFGISKCFQVESNEDVLLPGSKGFCPPEILASLCTTSVLPPAEHSDVYSFGITIACLVCEALPTAKPFTWPSETNELLKMLHDDCTVEIPESRPTMDEVVMRLEDILTEIAYD